MSGLQISIIIFSSSTTIFAFLISLVFFKKVSFDKLYIAKRVKIIKGKQVTGMDYLSRRRKALKKSKSSSFVFANTKFLDKLFDELILANIPLKPEEFIVIWMVLVFLPSCITILFTYNVAPSITLAILGSIAPIIFIRSRKKKRTRQFEAQLGDALMICCNCLRSGLTFQQAMETIAEDMSEPISVEFSRVVNEIRYGNNTESALNNLSNRIKSADLMLAVSAVNIQRQTGGNLSEILETISETIKERIKIKSDIRTLTAQGRMSGIIIGALPIGLFSILMVLNSEYMMLFFTNTYGKIMLGASIVMEITGYILIKKIVNITY